MSNKQDKKTNDFEIQPGKWTYQEFNDFVRAMQNGENREAGRLVGKILKSWKLDKPIAGDDPLLAAPMKYAAEIIRSVLPTCEEFIASIPTADFKVDLDVWTYEDFVKFQEHGANWDVPYIEAEIRRVVTVNGQPISADTLDYVVGGVAMRLISQAVKDAFNSKN